MRSWIFSACVFVILAGCDRSDSGKGPPPGTNQTSTSQQTPATPYAASLRLKWVHDPGFAGEMVAAKEGFFKNRGLDVTLKPGGFEADPIKLVATGSDTFGVCGADSFLLARAKGVPITAFAAGYIETPVVFYAKKESGINGPKDFVGRKVGVQAGQDTATVYYALLRVNGVNPDQVTEVPVKYDFTPFLTGQVEIWPGYAATQSYILETQNIAYKVVRPSEFGITYLGTVYFATEAFCHQHPELVQGFVDGLIEGWELTYSDEAKAIAAIASYDPKSLTPDLIRFNLAKQKPYIRPSAARFCEFSIPDFEATQRTLVEQKLLDKPVDLKGSAVTLRFIKAHYGDSQP